MRALVVRTLVRTPFGGYRSFVRRSSRQRAILLKKRGICQRGLFAVLFVSKVEKRTNKGVLISTPVRFGSSP